MNAAAPGASAVLLVGILAVSGCGARNDLSLGGSLGGGGGGTSSASSSSSSSSSSSGVGGAGGALSACAYTAAGDAVVALAFPDRHVSSPSLVVTGPVEGDAPARVALQGMASGGSNPAHSDVRLAELEVGDLWPAELTQTQPPVQAGDESHSWAEMAHAPGGAEQLAFSWFSDPGMVGRLAFRVFDLASWSPGPKTDVDFDGEVALALVPGMAVGEMGIGYDGFGYGLVWRRRVDPDNTQPLVGVFDVDGQILLGPHPVAAPADTPGRSPSATWSGVYLMATAFAECAPGDPLCVPNGIAVTRLRPASGDAWDDSGVELGAAIAAEEPGWRPRRPVITSHEGRTWIAWAEGPEGEGPLVIRLAELASNGTVIAGPARVAEDARPSNRPALVASEQGLALIWLQPSGDDGPPDQPGAAEVVVLAFDLDGEALAPAVRLPITAPQLGIPSAVVIHRPRSLLVTWSGAEIGAGSGGLDRAYLARFDCQPVPLR